MLDMEEHSRGTEYVGGLVWSDTYTTRVTPPNRLHWNDRLSTDYYLSHTANPTSNRAIIDKYLDLAGQKKKKTSNQAIFDKLKPQSLFQTDSNLPIIDKLIHRTQN